MDIVSMHEMFRVLGQQMGLERVRGILEESIDVCLNAAIDEITDSLIRSNVQTIYKDKITIQDNPISPVNGVSTLYKELDSLVNAKSGQVVILTISDVRYIYGFSISYPGTNTYKQCRIIEPDRVEITLDDYCSRASKQYPIITVVDVNESSDEYKLRIYTGGSDIQYIRTKYIKNPVKVSFDKNISCDLPEHLHKDIVEIAVNKYLQSVGSTTQNVRQ